MNWHFLCIAARRLCWHFLCIASLFSVVTCTACGAPPDVTSDVAPEAPAAIRVSPADDVLAASLDRALVWWRDAGPLPRAVDVEPAGTPGAIALAWSPATAPRADGTVIGGRDVGDRLAIAAECATWPASYLDTVVAHELGHAMGLGHTHDGGASLMDAEPTTPGELCIWGETVACREVR